jgi:hypothetical protein
MATLSTHTSGQLGNAVATVSVADIRADLFGHRHINSTTVEVDLREAGPALEGSHEFSLPASDTPTRVFVKSSVSAQAVREAKTAAAVALDRRRKALKIAKLVTNLPSHADAPDFHTYVHPVFHQVRTLLSELVAYDHIEGNTCMVLRYIRNSLIHPGWERYREKATTKAVGEILYQMGSLESVKRQDAKAAFAELHSLGLRLSLPVTLVVPPEADHGGEGAEEETAH